MKSTKMSVATDIILEQMRRINELSKSGLNNKNRKMLKDAITTSKTLNGSTASIIKEAGTMLQISRYADYSKQNINDVVEKLGINYDKD